MNAEDAERAEDTEERKKNSFQPLIFASSAFNPCPSANEMHGDRAIIGKIVTTALLCAFNRCDSEWGGVGRFGVQKGMVRDMHTVRRFRVVGFVALVLLGLLIGTAGSVAADQNYTCVDKSCAFSVPDSYTVASNDAAQIIFQDPASGGVFSVVTKDASSLNSLDDAVTAITTDATASNGYQVGPNNGQNTILGGNPATLIEYVSNNKSGLQVETAIFVTLYQGKEYDLIFVTTPANEDAFVASAKDVFDSWQFT